MRRLFVSSLGACAPPQAPLKKLSIGAAFGDLIGGVLGFASQENTNWSNELQTQWTNESNERINQSQLEWARQQYAAEVRENRYLNDLAWSRNSPAGQAASLRAAGLNPAVIMSNGVGSGQATTGSNPHANQPNMIPMQSAPPAIVPDGLGLGIANAVQTILQAQMNDAQIASLKAKSKVDMMNAMIEASKVHWENKYVAQQMKEVMQNMRFNDETWLQRKDSISLANGLIRAQQAEVEARTDAQRFAYSVAPELHELNKKALAEQIALSQAQAAQVYAMKDLNEKQKEYVIHQISEQTIRNANLPKTLHNENAIQVATYNQIKNQGLKIKQETENLSWEGKDIKRGYRQHIGNQRPLSDYVLDAIEKSRKTIK